MNSSREKAQKIIDEICDIYKPRIKTQAELANHINEKYNTFLTREDVGEITRDLGFKYTIDRSEKETVVVMLSEKLRKHIESERNNK